MITVNPANPVEFLACCGLLELAELYHPGNCRGFFVGSRKFMLVCPTPIVTLVHDLIHGVVMPKYTYKANGKQKLDQLSIDMGGRTLVLDWFTDSAYKCWSGNDNAYNIWTTSADRLSMQEAAKYYFAKITDIYNVLYEAVVPIKIRKRGQPQASKRFGCDPRTVAGASDMGFSPYQENVQVPIFVFAEMLHAVGMQRFRPAVENDVYSYFAWEQPLTAQVAVVGSLCGPGRLFHCTRKMTSKMSQAFTFAECVKCVN